MMDDDTYTLNIAQCIADKTRPAVIRDLFVMLRDQGYITPGEYFEKMNDFDLFVLRDLSEMIAQLDGGEPKTKQQEEAFANLLLLSLGLIVAEGGDPNTEDIVDAMKITMGFIALENLSRLGLIDVYRENWSMDPQHKGPIAKGRKLNEGDEPW